MTRERCTRETAARVFRDPPGSWGRLGFLETPRDAFGRSGVRFRFRPEQRLFYRERHSVFKRFPKEFGSRFFFDFRHSVAIGGGRGTVGKSGKHPAKIIPQFSIIFYLLKFGKKTRITDNLTLTTTSCLY